MNTKIRLIQLGKNQRRLLEALHKRGETSLDPATLSKIINYKLNTPQADRVRREIEEILTAWEKEREEE